MDPNNINDAAAAELNAMRQAMIQMQTDRATEEEQRRDLIARVEELLQEAGLVYGYTICSYNSNTYIIFLKYSENTNSSLKNVLFLNKRLCFKNRNTFAKNSLYLILNKKGFFISTVDNKSVSGYVIARF